MDDPNQNRVREYYAQFGEREWLRLCNAEDGAIEFAITCHTLETFLPSSGRVLDLGGGPGRYAIWLAQRGYRVVLADLSPQLLEIARQKIALAGVERNIEAVTEADARDLSRWSADYFDAVVSLGPFYHLPDSLDRKTAAMEMVRVLKPRAPAFVALMPRYALLRRTLAIQDERRHLRQPDWLARLMNDGRFDNDVAGRFNHAFGVRPEEVIPFFAEFGLTSLRLLAAESLSVGLQREIAGLASTDPATYAIALKLMIDAASDPSIHGLSNHLLYVGRKN
jgi:S-adenosylmethionine-dependent methyltransferase